MAGGPVGGALGKNADGYSAKLNAHVLLCALIGGLGGILFGYDNVRINPTALTDTMRDVGVVPCRLGIGARPATQRLTWLPLSPTE